MFMGTFAWPVFKQAYEIIKEYDKSNAPVTEMIFDKMFSAEVMSKLLNVSLEARMEYPTRKLDTSVAQHLYHLWKDKNYFDITAGLCEKLKDTDLRDLDTFFLRAPYRSMYLSLPKGNRMMIPGEGTGLHEVMGIYLLMNDFGKPETIAIRTENNKVPGVTKYLHILACGEEKTEYNDALVFFHLLFWEGKLSDSIAKNKEILGQSGPLWPNIQEIFTFVTKVLIYLNCANVEIRQMAGFDIQKKLDGLKSAAKKRKVLQRYEKTSILPHKLLDTIVDHDQGGMGKTGTSGHSLGPMALEKVRGHFKAQRYGEGLFQSKVIWVEPYVRGDGAEFYRDEKRYVLK
jgi:hypothetical protein